MLETPLSPTFIVPLLYPCVSCLWLHPLHGTTFALLWQSLYLCIITMSSTQIALLRLL